MILGQVSALECLRKAVVCALLSKKQPAAVRNDE